MGNELTTQTVNTSYPASKTPVYTQTNTNLNTAMPNNLFNAGIPKDYSNDVIMPDFLKTSNITDEQRASIFGPLYNQAQQTSKVQQTQNTQQNVDAPTFSGQNQASQAQLTKEQLEQYYKKLLEENPDLVITERGGIYEPTNFSKKTGILAGIITALYSGIKKVCTGTELKNAFNLRSLAVKLPVLAVAGWAIGSLIDAFVNSSKAQQTDAQIQTA